MLICFQPKVNKIISKNIENEFKCDEDVCNKIVNNIKIYYVIEGNTFFLKDGEINIQYDISNDDFDFNSSEMIFNIKNGKFTCNANNCIDYEKMYEKYFIKIIKKYI